MEKKEHSRKILAKLKEAVNKQNKRQLQDICRAGESDPDDNIFLASTKSQLEQYDSSVKLLVCFSPARSACSTDNQ
ncbi:hypothetical protein [Kiloniella laminariae]|uniref:hypothetical protein n=1 Tax=Kiloniella laminariae TaxID=454162 RepID=UPI0003637BD4|nr:hypothetical protein [Kiloniella laminariae]